MFFLRCAFWLTIVYASMSWPPGSLAPNSVGASLSETARSKAEALVKSAVAGATDLCLHQASTCAADAARLTALVGETRSAAEVGTNERDVDAAPTASIPMPVPDPRRRVRDAKLAHAS